MNINPIRHSDSIDIVSSLKTQVKPEKSDAVATKATQNSGLNNQATRTESDNRVKAEQNKGLKGESKLNENQKDDKKQPSMTDAQKMVDELNDYMDELHTSLGFSVSKDPNNQVIFQIRDRKTDEVIRQIPTEEIQKIKEKMTELTGLLLDQHV
ncbi:MAG: flagellar protein FlaG [Desulfamplus sp.]|nr:flagellar protein FlaG [Desulfamplus sp.]